jgi:uncharacterized protein (TIGR02145 family)
MKKLHLQKISLIVIVLFLVVFYCKEDTLEGTSWTPVTPLKPVTIGTQVWAPKNLDVTAYRDGTPIPEVNDETAWRNLTTGAWCYYENKTDKGTYGKLYNWYAVAGIHDNNPRTPNKVLAPTGWHVPNDEEWITLLNYLDPKAIDEEFIAFMKKNFHKGNSHTGDNNTNLAGGKMKSTDISTWATDNIGANNSSGFTGFPGGKRNSISSEDFMGHGFYGYWWSSTEFDTKDVWCCHLLSRESNAIQYHTNKKDGLSVRCLKD